MTFRSAMMHTAGSSSYAVQQRSDPGHCSAAVRGSCSYSLTNEVLLPETIDDSCGRRWIALTYQFDQPIERPPC